MRTAHVWIGGSIVAAFALMFLWGIAALVMRRGPGQPFWWLVTFVQVVLVVNLVAGLVLLVGGGRPQWLHYIYGIVFPVLMLAVAHFLARDAFRERPWLPFSIGAFFAFGLTLRAMMTGLGI
jgi:hypothetical protein